MAKHTAEQKAERRAHYERDKERILAANRDWYKRNKKRRVVTVRAWQERNRDRAAFNSHKLLAATRGIAFTLTFDQWLTIWQQSGHSHERGVGLGKYVMARFGNVRIALFEDNRPEQVIVPSAETRAKISAAIRARAHRRDLDMKR